MAFVTGFAQAFNRQLEAGQDRRFKQSQLDKQLQSRRDMVTFELEEKAKAAKKLQDDKAMARVLAGRRHFDSTNPLLRDEVGIQEYTKRKQKFSMNYANSGHDSVGKWLASEEDRRIENERKQSVTSLNKLRAEREALAGPKRTPQEIQQDKIDTEVEINRRKLFQKSDRDREDKWIQTNEDIQSNKGKLLEAQRALQSMTENDRQTGALSGITNTIKRYADAIGFDVDITGLNDAAVIDEIASWMTINATKNLKGAISEKELGLAAQQALKLNDPHSANVWKVNRMLAELTRNEVLQDRVAQAREEALKDGKRLSFEDALKAAKKTFKNYGGTGKERPTVAQKVDKGELPVLFDNWEKIFKEKFPEKTEAELLELWEKNYG